MHVTCNTVCSLLKVTIEDHSVSAQYWFVSVLGMYLIREISPPPYAAAVGISEWVHHCFKWLMCKKSGR